MVLLKIMSLSQASATAEIILLSTVIFSDKKGVVDILIASENTMLCYSNNTSNKSSSENSCHHCRRIKKAWQHIILWSLIRWSSPPCFSLMLKRVIVQLILCCFTAQSLCLLYLQLSKRNIWILQPYLIRSASLTMDFTQQEPLKEQVSLIALF